jgi:hypothetical protein
VASSFSDNDVRQDSAISSHQLAAAGAPGCRTSDLLGNFGDFSSVFGQIEEPPLIGLGPPLPKPKSRPKKRIGRCRAAHNRALLDGRKN